MESQSHDQNMITGDPVGNNNTHNNQSNNQSQSDANQIGQIYSLVNEAASAMSPSTMSLGSTMSSTMSRGRSKVWNEFSITGDGKKVTCRQCGDSLSYSHSHSTSSMLKHLKRKHNMDLYPPVSEEDGFKPCGGVKPQDKAPKKPTKPKKVTHDTVISQDECTPTEPSIQHDPLVFADPCVRMRWADHSDTFIRTFPVLYNDESYTDCTIVAEKQFFKAHRVILSSASEFFDEAFKMTPATHHPLIFLKDVKAMELRILLDFIYKGEVAIPPNFIPGLVKIGGDLKVKGLSDFVWNDQIASSIFQGYQNTNVADTRTQQPQPQQQQQQQQQQNHTQCHQQQQTSQQQPTHQPLSTVSPPSTSQDQQNFTTMVSNASALLGKTMNAFTRTNVMKQPTATSCGNPVQSSSTFAFTSDKLTNSVSTPSFLSTGNNARGYARVLSNMRSVNVLPGQNIGVSLGDASALLNANGSGLKRIRILTTTLPTSKSSGMISGNTRFDTGSDLGMECDAGPETVLMVTNQGETVLSTSQGGVTVMTPNTLSIPMGLSMKDDRCLSAHESHQLDHEHINSQPITILSSSGGTSAQDLEEVVYSITEVPGGGHEVLMSGTEGMDQDSIVVYGTHQTLQDCEPEDKKPFHLDMQKP